MATLVPCLVALRDEFNALVPRRDKRSDGWIGDAAHRERSSDHNIDDGPDQGKTPYEDSDSDEEVHALDVDDDFVDAPGGMTMALAVEVIRDRHRRGVDDRLQNIIYNGRIASESWGWTWKPYDGENQHTQHAHFGAKYIARLEADRRSWGLLERFGEDPDHMTQDEFNALLSGALDNAGVRSKLAKAVATTDNTVSLDGPGGTADAGLQSLIQWPRAGYAKSALDKINEVNGKLDQLISQHAEEPTTGEEPPPATTTAKKSTAAKASDKS